MATDYARFWKCALQVNPWNYSQQYQGTNHNLTEDAYNAALAERCLANEIAVVGIADHGSVEAVDKLRAALEATGIVVLPGFEIASTEKVHMVCLYPSGTPVASLNQYLGALGVGTSGSKTAPSSLGCLMISERVHKQGGFWYAAHITGANGLLRLNQDGGGLTHIWTSCDHVVAAQIPGDVSAIPEPEVQKILRNKNVQYQRSRPIALLNAKDVRKPDDLDDLRSYSWVKMTAPTLDALRLACRDPESRVRLSHEVNTAYYSRIEKVVVRRGYLEDLELELSPNLNAVVGGRGTGKSTLIEAIRYALQLTPANKDSGRAHAGIIDANLGKEKAGIEVTVSSFQQNSERYVISRYHGETAKVLDEHGKVLKLTPKDVLPRVEVYGQNELLAIVQDDTAKAALLGRFLPDDSQARTQLATLMESLKSNRTQIDGLEAKVADVTGRLDQLPALLDKEKSFKKLGIDAELEQVKTRETQRAYVGEVAEALGTLGDAVETFKDAIEEMELPEPPVEHGTELAAFTQILNKLKTSLLKAAKSAAADVEKASDTMETASSTFDQSIAAAEQAFNVAVNKLPAMKGKSVAQLAGEFKRVSGDIAKLKPLGSQKTVHETKLLALRQERANLLQQLADARSKRWTALGKAVKTLNKRLEGQLRVEFEPGGVRTPLREYFLDECPLDGIGEKRLNWIDDADPFTVAELVDHIQQGPDALMGRFKKAGMVKQVADALANLTASQIRSLEELELPERMELLLNVAPGGDAYRPVGNLSTGQQCTAVLHLLLLDNPDPLVIDQPEDNLDNAFIADHIVNELRTSKTKRQFLFATHNANIPVFGDAEWIGVLEEFDGRARLRASGSIDSPDVKNLAASILEGGKEAFTHRREKYGL